MARQQAYFDDLRAQGYPEDEALKWTQKYYSEFLPQSIQSQNTQIAEVDQSQLLTAPTMFQNTLPVPIHNTLSKKVPIKIISFVTILVASIIVTSILPPGAIAPMDELRVRDDDGLTDSEELALGTNPMSEDTDNDGIDDLIDECANGNDDWESTVISDLDSDGCQDDNEDKNDDNDGFPDSVDNCPRGKQNWSNQDLIDRDSDGCVDDFEDLDDDGDMVNDFDDDCPYGFIFGWVSNINSDYDGDGCYDVDEDFDDDGDSIVDAVDSCPKGIRNWIPSSSSDYDSDGCKDNDEDSDDDNDGITDYIDECSKGTLSWTSNESNDFDSDGCKDNNEDLDDDNDGFEDYIDIFPFNPNEWSDFDQDGIGDNSDDDDDNDGVTDFYDANDFADVGIELTFDFFEVITKMDYFDNQAEVFICMFVEGENVGCGPDDRSYHWSLTTSTVYILDTEIFVDLPEENASHLIQICAWDEDVSNNDRIDINPDSSNDCYNLYFDSTTSASTSITTVTTTGVGDSTGWDGELQFSYILVDLRVQRMNQYSWGYDGQDFSINLNLDYNTYSIYKNKDHTVGGIYDVESYARFSTPYEQYVFDIANDLKDLAIQSGYSSDLEIAEFIYSFVGNIQYVLDIEGSGVSDYPKYPIEMLWESSGDCEDAAILYISLIESIDYDAMFAVGLVKSSEDDDWGGHAWAVVHIPNHSGDGWYGMGTKSDIPFYFVEATGYYEGSSYIGRDPWYEIKDVSFFDVE